MEPTLEFQAMIDRNEWHTRDELLDTVVTALALSQDRSGWHWGRNTACKYIDICIDMRSGGFVMMDRMKRRISLEQLKWQYQLPDEAK